MTFMFTTLLLLPLAEATTLQFTVPIFATILGAVILHETTGIHRWGAVVFGFLGVLIVTQPGSGHIPLAGAATGLAAAFLSSSVSILIRGMRASEPPATIVFYFSVLSMVPLVPVFLWTMGSHAWTTWAMLVGVGLVGAFGQLAMTTSLSLAPVSVVVPMDYSGLIWATLYGWAVVRGAAGRRDLGRRADHRRQWAVYRLARTPSEPRSRTLYARGSRLTTDSIQHRTGAQIHLGPRRDDQPQRQR